MIASAGQKGRWRAVIGLVAGALLVASGFAHSYLGWQAMRGALARTAVPSDLVADLALGWQFAGVSMLAFGFIALWVFARRLRDPLAPTVPALIIGVAYVLYAAGALVRGAETSVWLTFLVPGIMLLIGAA